MDGQTKQAIVDELESISKQLEPIRIRIRDARDEAQRTLAAIQNFKQSIVSRQIALLRESQQDTSE